MHSASAPRTGPQTLVDALPVKTPEQHFERRAAHVVNSQALDAALVSFATRLTDRYDVDDVLNDVSNRALAVLAVDGAGLAIGPNPAAGDMHFVSATDDATTRVERWQDEVGEGVCYEAAAAGQTVLVDSFAAGNRWPRFTPVALEEGFRAAAGVPLVTDGELIGVLDLYRNTEGPWPDEDVAAAQLIARMATTYLINATRLGEARKLAAQLQEALDSRIVIEQAKGVLSERLSMDPDAAFELMRSYARTRRSPVRPVAHGVLTGEIIIVKPT